MVNPHLLQTYAAVLAVAALTCPPAFAQSVEAQSSTPPIQLRVEKRRSIDEPADTAPNSLRISRDQLKLNAVPSFAPDFRKQSGARIDPGDFSLGAQDWTLQGNAEKQDASNAVGIPQFPKRAELRTPLKGRSSFAAPLGEYDIEIIVDESMSMRKRDCPGGLSRWEWCGEQLGDLSSQLNSYLPHGFNLTTFAGFFETHPNSTSRELHTLFANPMFSPGTRLSLPLQARLSDYFARRTPKSKPLLIVVITDGVPAPKMEPPRVAQVLIDASAAVRSPQEVTVVFFQIGGTDYVGRFFLDRMDNGLVAHGAAYDIVRTVYFEQLINEGLTGALVAAVRDYAQRTAAR